MVLEYGLRRLCVLVGRSSFVIALSVSAVEQIVRLNVAHAHEVGVMRRVRAMRCPGGNDRGTIRPHLRVGNPK